MTDTTVRFALPMLTAGQAQKELFHNEALTLLDFLSAPAAETIADNTPPSAPVAGQAWIIGASPVAAWSGKTGQIACWTDSGWRFIAPTEGMSIWVRAIGLWAQRGASGWTTGMMPATVLTIGGNQVVGARRPAISTPSGGATSDAEARTAIGGILAALRAHGLIAS